MANQPKAVYQTTDLNRAISKALKLGLLDGQDNNLTISKRGQTIIDKMVERQELPSALTWEAQFAVLLVLAVKITKHSLFDYEATHG
jgi:hypothetical protein